MTHQRAVVASELEAILAQGCPQRGELGPRGDEAAASFCSEHEGPLSRHIDQVESGRAIGGGGDRVRPVHAREPDAIQERKRATDIKGIWLVAHLLDPGSGASDVVDMPASLQAPLELPIPLL